MAAPVTVAELAKDKQWAQMNELIEKTEGNTVNETDPTSANTALHWACSYAALDTVKHLLSRGADINMQNNNGDTCLHLAAKIDDFSVGPAAARVVDELLRSGADYNMRNKLNKSAVDCAALSDVVNVFRVNNIHPQTPSVASGPLGMDLAGIFDFHKLQTLLERMESQYIRQHQELKAVKAELEIKAGVDDLNKVVQSVSQLSDRVDMLEQRMNTAENEVNKRATIDDHSITQRDVMQLKASVLQKAESRVVESIADRVSAHSETLTVVNGSLDDLAKAKAGRSVVDALQQTLNDMGERVHAVESLIHCKIDRTDLSEFKVSIQDVDSRCDDTAKKVGELSMLSRGLEQKILKAAEVARDKAEQASVNTIETKVKGLAKDMQDVMKSMKVVSEDTTKCKGRVDSVEKKVTGGLDDVLKTVSEKYGLKEQVEGNSARLDDLDGQIRRVRRSVSDVVEGLENGKFKSGGGEVDQSAVAAARRASVDQEAIEMALEGYKKQIVDIRAALASKADVSMVKDKVDKKWVEDLFSSINSKIEESKKTVMSDVQKFGYTLRTDLSASLDKLHDSVIDEVTRKLKKNLVNIKEIQEDIAQINAIMESKANTFDLMQLKEYLDGFTFEKQFGALTTKCLSCDQNMPYSMKSRTPRGGSGVNQSTLSTISIGISPRNQSGRVSPIREQGSEKRIRPQSAGSRNARSALGSHNQAVTQSFG